MRRPQPGSLGSAPQERRAIVPAEAAPHSAGLPLRRSAGDGSAKPRSRTRPAGCEPPERCLGRHWPPSGGARDRRPTRSAGRTDCAPTHPRAGGHRLCVCRAASRRTLQPGTEVTGTPGRSQPRCRTRTETGNDRCDLHRSRRLDHRVGEPPATLRSPDTASSAEHDSECIPREPTPDHPVSAPPCSRAPGRDTREHPKRVVDI